MVRQRSDPGGASRMSTSGQDPDAAVARGKDIEDVSGMIIETPVVFEARQQHLVVDEIRDSDYAANDIRELSDHRREAIVQQTIKEPRKQESRLKEEPSSSWFLFDWAIGVDEETNAQGPPQDAKTTETKVVPELGAEHSPESKNMEAKKDDLTPKRDTFSSVKPDVLSIFQREAQSKFVSDEFNTVLPVVAGKEVTSMVIPASSTVPIGTPKPFSISDELRNLDIVLSSAERRSSGVVQYIKEDPVHSENEKQETVPTDLKTENEEKETTKLSEPESQNIGDFNPIESTNGGCLCFPTCEGSTVATDETVEETKITTQSNESKHKDQHFQGNSEGGFFSAIVRCIDPEPEIIQDKPKESTKTKTHSTNPAVKTKNTDEATKLLGSDLDSLPSVKEDVKDSIGIMKKEDLPTRGSNKNSASIVENKVKQMKISQLATRLDQASVASRRSGSDSGLQEDDKLDARRQIMIKELRSAIDTFGRYDVRCANSSAALGDLLDEAGEYEHAIKLHKDAVTIYRCKFGDDHTTTLNAKIRLGTILENAGYYDEAINQYYLVTVMRRGLKGEQDPSVADGLVCMANVLRKKGEYMAAIKELKRALKIYRESLGDAHKKVAETVDQIASTYVTLGDFDKAAAILEEVVKLKAATMGMKNKEVAVTLAHLATAYECSEKLSNALKALKKCYKIHTELEGYSSVDAVNTLNRMAQLYEAMKDENRASVAYLGVLRGRKIQHGADHLSVGETYFRLGHTLRETKQYDKALKCLKEALPIFVGQGVAMKDVKMVADIMHEMALVNHDRGHYQDAIRIYKQELSVRRKMGQPEFPMVAKTLKCLGIAEYRLKNHSRALKYLVEALTIIQERGDEGIECGEVLFYSGLVFYAVRNKDRAFEALVEAVRIFSDHGFDDDHPMLFKANEMIEEMKKLHNS